MTSSGTTYVLDTGPLSHFAKSQWLGVLKVVLKEHQVVVPDVVAQELRNGVGSHPHLQVVLDADWITTVPLDTVPQLVAFAHYEQRMVGEDGRNVGECGVLALSEATPGAIAVIDDRVAAKAGRDRGVVVRGTLGLLCDAIRGGLLTVSLVSALADDLMANQYRLPFKSGGFAEWAEQNDQF